MDLEKIGKFIKELRLKKGLSQNNLSEELHITRQAISNWENGKALPDSDMLRILSKFFKVTVDDILSGEKVKGKNHLQETTLILVDETNKKQSKIKKMMISYASTLMILLLLFLGYYFVTNYNSIKVYMISGENEKLKKRNGIAISTKQKGYFHIGNINYEQNDNKTINTIELHFKSDDNKDIILYKSKDTTENYTFIYSFKNRKDQKRMVKGIYAIIKFENKDVEEIVKLKLSEDYNNSFFINPKNNEKVKTIVEEVETSPPIQEVFEKVPEEEPIFIPIYDDGIDNSLIEIVEPEPIYYPPAIPIDTTPEPKAVIEEEKEIDYEKVVGLVLQYGTDQMGMISYEFMEDDQFIIISTDENCLYIDSVNNNILKSWRLTVSKKILDYQKFEDFFEIENGTFDVFDNNSIIENMNNYIKLFLKKIEESN